MRVTSCQEFSCLISVASNLPSCYLGTKAELEMAPYLLSLQQGIFLGRTWLVRYKSVHAVAIHCDVMFFFYLDKLQHYTINTLFACIMPPTLKPSPCLWLFLQGLTCPHRASSMCSDAWPFPLGLRLALHQSSREKAGEGKGWRWEGREEKRKRENRTQNSICSGLDGSFFSLERPALNPICASCQLCLRVPRGDRKWQLLTSFTVGQVSPGLTCAGPAPFGWRRVKDGCVMLERRPKHLNWIGLIIYQVSILILCPKPG